MEITFLIGNGFDRALGLETSYSDFYRWYNVFDTSKLPSHVKKFREEIDKYVRQAPDAKPYWADAEIGLANYTENFSLENVEEFMDCFEDFRNNLINYLNQETSKIDTDFINKCKPIFKQQISNFYQELDPTEKPTIIQFRNSGTATEFHFNAISFNYTKAFDLLFSSFSESLDSWRGNDHNTHYLKVGKLIHAHGYIDQYPILGVCHTSLIKNQELINNDLFKAMMLKKQGIIAIGQLWRKEVEDLIQKSSIICVFGMSLGDSDSDYWEMLTSWLHKNPNKHLIVYWRNSKLKNLNISIREKYTETEYVKNRFWEFSSLKKEEFNKIKNQIHVVINSTKMFYIPKENSLIHKKHISPLPQ